MDVLHDRSTRMDSIRLLAGLDRQIAYGASPNGPVDNVKRAFATIHVVSSIDGSAYSPTTDRSTHYSPANYCTDSADDAVRAHGSWTNWINKGTREADARTTGEGSRVAARGY